MQESETGNDGASAFTSTLSRRFPRSGAKTLLAQTASKSPIALSRIITEAPAGQKTGTPAAEAAYAIHVHLAPLTSAETWINGRHAPLPHVPSGGLCLFDLSTSPVALVHEPMDFLRVYISQRTLDDLAYDRGQRPVAGLASPALGHYDPVLHSLASAMVSRIDLFDTTDTLFADYIALAFHAHVVQTYGEAREAELWRGGLAPWQFRRACELMVTNLAEGVAISELAEACDVSASYFARAFKLTAGVPPHKWMMNERVERVKAMLRAGTLSLSEIAATCGFTDQSHLSRVFSSYERQTPGRWRRLCHM